MAKERINALREKYIESIMEKTGWSHDAAKTQLDIARQKGIYAKEYTAYKFYEIPIEEHTKKYKEILEAKVQEIQEKLQKLEKVMEQEALQIEEKAQEVILEEVVENVESVSNTEVDPQVKKVVEKTGWSIEYAIDQMEDAKMRLGINFKDYIRYAFYKISHNDQEKKYKDILAKREKQAADKQAELEKTIEKVVKLTGWESEFARTKILDARKRTGCAFKEYVLYKFYELEDVEQETYFLIRDSVRLANKYDVNKEFSKILCDKELTNERFAEYLRRPWCVNTKISEEEFCEKFVNSKRVIYKPLHGNRGKGVEAFDIDAQNAKKVYQELKTYPEGVVEQYVVQHQDLINLAPSSVNTIRIVTISSNTKPVTKDGKFVDVAYSALRIGGGTSIVDNFHSGGMTAAVDLETGKLITDAADMEGNVFAVHPMTGVTIKGFQIPRFDEALKMVTDACVKNKIEGYLGWDIAITEDGPVLIEINLRPGVVLLSTPYIAEKKGMKHVMAKYL